MGTGNPPVPMPAANTSRFRHWPSVKRYGSLYMSAYNRFNPLTGLTEAVISQCDAAAANCDDPGNWSAADVVHQGDYVQRVQVQHDNVRDNRKMMVVWQESVEVNAAGDTADRVFSSERCGLSGPWSAPELVYDPADEDVWVRLQFGTPQFVLHGGAVTLPGGGKLDRNLALVAMIAGMGSETAPDSGDVIVATKNYVGCP